MNKKILTVIMIAATIVGVVVGGFFIFKTDVEDSEIVDITTITTTIEQEKENKVLDINTSSVKIYYSDEDKWNTHKNDDYGFSFKYPDNWTIVILHKEMKSEVLENKNKYILQLFDKDSNKIASIYPEGIGRGVRGFEDRLIHLENIFVKISEDSDVVDYVFIGYPSDTNWFLVESDQNKNVRSSLDKLVKSFNICNKNNCEPRLKKEVDNISSDYFNTLESSEFVSYIDEKYDFSFEYPKLLSIRKEFLDSDSQLFENEKTYVLHFELDNMTIMSLYPEGRLSKTKLIENELNILDTILVGGINTKSLNIKEDQLNHWFDSFMIFTENYPSENSYLQIESFWNNDLLKNTMIKIINTINI